MASIFDVQRPAIVKHINNIYKFEEFKSESTCSILEQVGVDWKKQLSRIPWQFKRIPKEKSGLKIN